VQVAASRAGDFDDKPWFAHLNSSKRSLAVDLKRPESRELIDPLLRWADVVVENFSPGTMEKLGLGYAQLAARNPAVVMASGSVYGQSGPLSQEWASMRRGVGRALLTGWLTAIGDRAVRIGDVIVPYVMSACIAAALVHRRDGSRLPHRCGDVRDLRATDARGLLAAQRRAGGAPRQ
jgi:crotonobetainyl-CoA:carnitine CoA-transferase CaiB-like acyl-CoA transferase